MGPPGAGSRPGNFLQEVRLPDGLNCHNHGSRWHGLAKGIRAP